MNTKFELFLNQIEIANKKNLNDTILDSVFAHEKEKKWVLNFNLPSVFSPKEIADFLSKVDLLLKPDFINELIVNIKYVDKSLDNIDMMEYWDLVVSDLINKRARFTILKSFNVTYKDNEYTINVAKDEAHLSRYESLIADEFKKYGLEVSVKFVVCDDLRLISEEIDENISNNVRTLEEMVKKQELEAATEKKPVKIGKFQYKKDITKDEPVDIKNIPVDQLGLEDYAHNVDVPIFTILGQVFELEMKKMPKAKRENTHLFTCKITDNTDSILVKRFAFADNELEVLNQIKVGSFIKVNGRATYDTFIKDIVINADAILIVDKPSEKNNRDDKSTKKRVELHAHTIMSAMDSIANVDDLIGLAEKWGHKAIAITDHDCVYSFPDIAKACKGKEIKPIYGAELSMVDEDSYYIAFDKRDIPLRNASYVIFDIETTGLSTDYDEIIEIGAYKYINGQMVDVFEEFIKPSMPLTKFTTDLTGITDDMLRSASGAEVIIPRFYEFCQDSILVAHNANFDIGHIYANFDKLNIKYEKFPAIDTMTLARALYFEQMKFFGLDPLVRFLKVKLENHHRATDDAMATAKCFLIMLDEVYRRGVSNYQDFDKLHEDVYKKVHPYHVTALVKNQTGYRNLFKIISDELTTHLYKGPRALKSVISQNREGLLIGSACCNGEVFETALNKSYEELLAKIDFYDYIEVQPPSVYAHLKLNTYQDGDYIINTTIEKIIKAAKEKNKIVVATGDVHYINPEDQMLRDVYLRTPSVGGGRHTLAKFPSTTRQHFRTTDEMIIEFSFLNKDLVHEIVIDNTNLINDMIENVSVFPKGLFAPADDEFKDSLGVPSIEEELKRMVNENVHALYGAELPEIVSERLNKELNSIINNKFSSVYYMSHLLVKKSLDDGYLVGSRGSVGSSFVATMMNITEVNPLSPHYRCPRCQFSSFKMNDEEKKKYGVRKIEERLQVCLDYAESGYDLPDAKCPCCGANLVKDGHDIPFETFLGFKGDKVPDIDLNFSGEYQPKAHDYIRSVMGYDYAYRAGTIATVAEKTAFGFVDGYFKDNNIMKRRAEIERIAKKVEGVRRSTGQHPGGIVVVPSRIEIFDVTPIQYPADDSTNSFRTTHFDYHSFESNLLKLDILGHDDPTLIKFLMQYVYAHPEEFPFNDARNIPVDDKEVLKLFSGTEVLGVTPNDIMSEVASYAVPEFGTDFVRQMLVDTKPKTFAELVKISGLSHGTDVWLNNAQMLVLGNKPELGKVEFKEVIGCRDDIMVYLMYQGLEPAKAFEIMEFVRKGKASGNPEKWKEYEEYMRSKRVPEWYIWSCGQIKYMFPKAHATAYVLMALRIAWFKVHKPILFYCAYFSKRADTFDIEVMCSSANGIKNKINELKNGNTTLSAAKADDLLTCLYVALEMVQRGFSFKVPDLNISKASEFVIDDKSLIFPFGAIDGMGPAAAESIVEARENKLFTSKEDFASRTKTNKTVIEKMDSFGIFSGLKDNEEKQEYDLFAFSD